MNLSEFIYTVLLKPRPLKASANWVLKKIIPAKINVDGAVICLNPEDPVISGALALNVFEKDEIAMFKKLFDPGMTFLDIGANVGLYSGLALSTRDFHGKVICMEPDLESANYLDQTLQANRRETPEGNIIVCRSAASDYQGTALLHKNPENKGDNRLYADASLQASQEIPVTTVDAVCRENGIEHIDFIKIDVQGAEGKAIRGATSILRNSPDCIILSELWPWGLTQYGSSLQSYVDSLQALGFELYELKKKGGLHPFDIDTVAREYTGRKYTNIVGLKGRYRPETAA